MTVFMPEDRAYVPPEHPAGVLRELKFWLARLDALQVAAKAATSLTRFLR